MRIPSMKASNGVVTFSANSVYDIDNVWHAGSDVNFVSDKSYLPRYN